MPEPNPLTKAEFERLLQKAAQPITPPKPEESAQSKPKT